MTHEICLLRFTLVTEGFYTRDLREAKALLDELWGVTKNLARKSHSLLRHPGLTHTLINTLALSQKSRIVTFDPSTKAVDGEHRVEGKPRPSRRTGFLYPTELRQASGEEEMCDRSSISVVLDRPM